MSQLFPRALVVSFFLSLTLAGCSSDEPTEAGSTDADTGSSRARITDSAFDKSNPLLDFVPANTALYFGVGAPIHRDQFLPLIERTSIYRHVDVNSLIDDGPEPTSDGGKMLRELHRRYLEFTSDLSRASEVFGTGDIWNLAVYTVDAMPVIRFALDDESRFLQTINEAETKAGVTATPGNVGSLTVKLYPLEKKTDGSGQIDLVIAAGDGFGVITVYPGTLDASHLERSLGTSPPQESLKSAGTLKEIATEHGFGPEMIGFVNHVRVVDLLTSDGENAFFSALGALGENSQPATSDHALKTPACEREIADIASRWPRTVFGYDTWELSASPMRINGVALIETTNTEFLDQLRTLEGLINMPAFAADTKPVFSFSLGVNVDQVMPFLTWFNTAMNDKQYQCEALAQLTAMSSRGFAAGMVAGMLPGVKGINLTVLDLTLGENPGQPVDALDAFVAVTTDNPEAIIAMARNYLPMLADLNLRNDGTPVPLELPLPGAGQLNPMLSMHPGHLLLFAGAQSAATAAAMLSGSNSGFMAFQMDYAKYFGLVMQGIEHSGGGAGLGSEEQKMMDAMSKLNATVDFRFDVEDRGIRFGGGMTLHQ